MEQSNNGDRIERDAEEIASAAADIERKHAAELAAEGEKSRIDAEIAELSRKRAEQEQAQTAAHNAIVADEKRIADADRDLKEALGASCVSGGSGGQGGGHGDSGPGGGPGPKNPPVVPPRRVG